ncbi:MAG: hypothetical protein PUP90_24005 [Nostoc sp. S4]|nr:hypothetical protein [Nostoc sp. S4]
MGDPVSLILAALVAGASKTAGEAVQDAYKGLKELIKRKFDNKPQVPVLLEEHEKKPEIYKSPVSEMLKELGADRDEEIVKEAQKVNQLNDPEGAKAGKYNINIQGGIQGVAGENLGTVNQTINNP